MYIHKVLQFWYRYMITLLLMLANTLLSMYVTKQSFIHRFPIQLCNWFFIYFITEKLISGVTVTTEMYVQKLIHKQTN